MLAGKQPPVLIFRKGTQLADAELRCVVQIGSPGDGPVALAALAGDRRPGHQLLFGDGDGGMALDRDADLARRTVTLVGTAGSPTLARQAGVSGRGLLRRALAWGHGGPDGLRVMVDPWRPLPRT